jgi:uncharacterized membrane protein
MKRILFAFLSLLLLFSPQTILAKDIDQINSFTSEITINKDASISIKETIDYETSLQKHGIFRYIPIRYNKDGVSFSAQVTNIQIKDVSNKAIQFEKTTDNRNVTLKIGDPNSTFTGEKTYVISYEVEYALQEFADHDELYWDITGEGWQIPILSSMAIIRSDVASIRNVICYSGTFGENDGKCTSSFQPNQAEFEYDEVIDYGDNMTVAIAFAKPNLIQFPTEQQKMIKRIKDNALIAIPFLPMLFMFWLWYKKGRDWVFISPNVFNLDPDQPKRLKPIFGGTRIPFVYEPFKDLTPGEAGLILDEKVDNQDVIAEIIDLARQKYLSISAVDKKRLIGRSRDYQFKKLKVAPESLAKQQKFLMTKLFATGDEVLLSDLKGSFYSHIATAKTKISQSLYGKKLFTSDPNTTRVLYMLLAFGLSVLVFILASMISGFLLVPAPMVSLVTILPIFILGWNMVQKTAVGTALSMQAKGLQQTIKRGAWREKIMEKNLFFQEMLPFAIALGVVKQLSKDMEKLNVKPPEYFSDPMIRSIGFNSFINSFSSQATNSLSYNPSSSRSSGGSGFSGGSSGGGGGGGGGGSW